MAYIVIKSGIKVVEQKALTTFQAAQICGVHHRTIARWVQQGYLKAFKTPGGHLRILREDLERFIARHQTMGNIQEGVVKVLIVDDEEAFRDSAVRLLNKEDYLVVKGAHDGYTAGWLLGHFKPDIVVLDLIMPDLNGFDICKTIKESPEHEHTVVIVLTGFSSSQNLEKARECGADLCLAKPIELDLLKDKIREVIKERGILHQETGA